MAYLRRTISLIDNSTKTFIAEANKKQQTDKTFRVDAIIDGKFIWGKTVRKNNLVNPTSIPYFHSHIKKYRWWVQDVSASIPGELLINSD